MRHVGAAQVEGPRQALRIGDYQRVRTQALNLTANSVELRICAFAREAHIVQLDGTERWSGAVRPDRRDHVRLDRDQRRAGSNTGFAEAFSSSDRMQPGIVAQPIAAREVLLDPALRWHVNEVFDSK